MEICDVIQGIREPQHISAQKMHGICGENHRICEKNTESVKRVHILNKIPGFQVSISGSCTLMLIVNDVTVCTLNCK